MSYPITETWTETVPQYKTVTKYRTVTKTEWVYVGPPNQMEARIKTTRVPDGTERVLDGTEDVTKSDTLWIPTTGSLTPDQLADGIETGGELHDTVNSTGPTIESIEGNHGLTETELKELDSLVEAVICHTANNGQATIEQTNEGIADTGNTDPVRLATGTFVTSAVDIRYLASDFAIQIQRKYQSSREGVSHSFGKGWSFNYDTRIIRGVKPRAEDEASESEGKASKIATTYQATLDAYNAASVRISQALRDAQDKRDGLKEAVAVLTVVLNDAKGAGRPTQLISRVESDLAGAKTLRDKAIALVQRADQAQADLEDRYLLIDEIRLAIENVEQKAQDSRNQAELAAANRNRNRYVVNNTDPEHLQFTGNQTIILIDETDTPHIYTIDNDPGYYSTNFLSDGSMNYFPNGSSATSVLPNDDRLDILPDGTYAVTKKDGTRFLYSVFGQLETIIDTNDNRIVFHYDEDHYLVQVEDAFGRSLILHRQDGRVIKAVDPAGREYKYSHDADGYLNDVTDSEGTALSYHYNGNLLTDIVKPDGSRRTYVYKAFNGKVVVELTRDEEGAVESFRYFPDHQYTEHINPSGILERHYFNGSYLTTMIEYENGASVQMGYDENNNLITETDELRRVKRYAYDTNRNLIEAVDPAGNVERWIYNAFNKVTSYTDKMGNTTMFTYDVKGNLLSITYPDASVTRFVSNDRGQLIKTIDQLGNSTSFEYDQNGYVSKKVDAEGSVELFEYDSIGNLLKYTDQLGNETRFTYNGDNKLVAITDSKGYIETLEYNNRKDLVRRTDKNGHSIDFEYDKRHKLIKVTNALGEEVAYQYRGDGKLNEKIVAGDNHTTYPYDIRGNPIEKRQVESDVVTRYEYDAAQQLTALVDPNGNRTEFRYNPRGLVEKIINPEGNSRVFAYDTNNNLTSMTDEKGNAVQFTHDVMNRTIKLIDQNGNEILNTYDLKGNLISRVDQNGNVTQLKYDTLDRSIQITDPLGQTQKRTYDSRGLVIRETDKRGNSRRLEYDHLGRIIKATDSLGRMREFAYDSVGNLVSRKDENGNITRFVYDPLNRVSAVTDAKGNTTTYAYNVSGLEAKVKDALGNETQFEYDENGRLLARTDPLGAVKRFTYDQNGNLTTVIDEEDNPIFYKYDSLNRLIKITDALGEEHNYRYDEVENLVQEINGSGAIYSYEYDSLNRRVKEINPLGDEQTNRYDANGNLCALTDYNGKETINTYDALNRLVTQIFADGSKKTFTYDAADNIISAISPQVEEYFVYDELNRLIESKVVGLCSFEDEKIIRYGYDSVGNRITRTLVEKGEERSTVYAYDELNRLIGVTDGDDKTTAFTFDPLGRVICKRFPNDWGQDYTYDPAGRIKTLLAWREKKNGTRDILKSFGYLYDRSGKRTYQIEGDSHITNYRYDTAGRLTDVNYPFEHNKKISALEERLEAGIVFEQPRVNKQAWAEGIAELNNLEINKITREFRKIVRENDHVSFLWNNEGRSKKRKKPKYRIQIGSEALPFVSHLDMPIDVEEELGLIYETIRDEFHPIGLDPTKKRYWKEIYIYDKASNIDYRLDGWGKLHFSYDEANRITQLGNRCYSYDANGNLIKEQIGVLEATYRYNAENRLIAMQRENPWEINPWRNDHTAVSYGYDALGRKSYITNTELKARRKWGRRKKKRKWREEENMYYIYDGLVFDAALEYREMHRGRSIRSHIHDILEYHSANGQLLSVQRVVKAFTGKQIGGRKKTYFLQDPLGSTVLTISRGRKKEYTYDAYGKLYQGKLSYAHNIGYNGKAFDPITELYNYGFRHYSPTRKRWQTVDPIRDSFNWYAYVDADPINYIDPFGLNAQLENDGIGAGSGGGGGGAGIVFGGGSGLGSTAFTYNINIGSNIVSGILMSAESEDQTPEQPSEDDDDEDDDDKDPKKPPDDDGPPDLDDQIEQEKKSGKQRRKLNKILNKIQIEEGSVEDLIHKEESILRDWPDQPVRNTKQRIQDKMMEEWIKYLNK